ncbi:MAG: twin-arginine translocation signal domain-containing protein, partial [Chloroflexota bacterium]|nr:twin-arginine translocation signal domain-containing protein [Chloroflexota bacterium]
MKPLHEYYDDLMKGRIDRRTFFKRAAAAGATTPLIANWLSQPAAASYLPASHNHFSLTRAAAQSATMAPPAEGIDTAQ